MENELRDIINKTIEEVLAKLKDKDFISEEIPQSEEDNTMLAVNMSTATWREGKNEQNKNI